MAQAAPKTSEVRNLLKHSPAFPRPPWIPIHLKAGEKGPMVREVKVISFRMQRDGLPTRPHWRMAARNPEQPDDDRPTDPVESLTRNQIRDALTVWFDAWPLGAATRKRRLEKAAWQISYTRSRNAAAKVSHRKTTTNRLRKLGIDLTRIRTCIGSNFAL